MTPSERRSPPSAADWLASCRRAADGVRTALEEYPETPDRGRQTGRGEGGDMTLVIDRAAEDAIFTELESLGEPLTAVSEERGEVSLNGGGPVTVVIDPIDGSLNAKRRLPIYSVSIAVATGSTMGAVQFGYVADLGGGEEWWAERGAGAHLDGRRLPPLAHDARLEMLGLETSHPHLVAAAAEALAATGASRLRALGSIALTMCAVAAGRLDGMLSLRPARSVDAAAGQLIIREAGGCVAFPDVDPDPLLAPLDLGMRSRVLGAASAKILDGLSSTVAAPVSG